MPLNEALNLVLGYRSVHLFSGQVFKLLRNNLCLAVDSMLKEQKVHLQIRDPSEFRALPLPDLQIAQT